jgi:hypothetical protein
MGGYPTCQPAPYVIKQRIQFSISLYHVSSWQVWTLIMNRLGLLTIAPWPGESCFSNWWYQAVKGFDKKIKKRLNSLIILVAWGNMEASKCLCVWRSSSKCPIGSASHG